MPKFYVAIGNIKFSQNEKVEQLLELYVTLILKLKVDEQKKFKYNLRVEWLCQYMKYSCTVSFKLKDLFFIYLK